LLFALKKALTNLSSQQLSFLNESLMSCLSQQSPQEDSEVILLMLTTLIPSLLHVCICIDAPQDITITSSDSTTERFFIFLQKINIYKSKNIYLYYQIIN
jgi:hypothetical protein